MYDITDNIGVISGTVLLKNLVSHKQDVLLLSATVEEIFILRDLSEFELSFVHR